MAQRRVAKSINCSPSQSGNEAPVEIRSHRGIVDRFETWKQVSRTPCLRGDLAATARLTIYEPDDQKDPRPIHIRTRKPLDRGLAQAREGW
jgi:hypothetical protein